MKNKCLIFVYDGFFALVVVLFQVVLTCLRLFSVLQIFLVVLACVLKLFPMFLTSSCVFQLDFGCFLSCGVCFGWFYIVLGCFAMFLVSCFNWCLVVSTFFNVVC